MVAGTSEKWGDWLILRQPPEDTVVLDLSEIGFADPLFLLRLRGFIDWHCSEGRAVRIVPQQSSASVAQGTLCVATPTGPEEAEVRYELAERGLVFSTRDRGARILADIQEIMGEAPREPLVIDFRDVVSVSYSFVDEFVGEMFARTAQETAPILEKVPPAACRTIERSLTRRGLDSGRILATNVA